MSLVELSNMQGGRRSWWKTNGLHLPDLTIKGFRGIDELSIPRLGRVTLVAGMNSIGKTTVLEAVRVYAARGRYSPLFEILTGRGEVDIDVDEDGERVLEPVWEGLFFGRHSSEAFRITIGPSQGLEQLTIAKTFLNEQDISKQGRLFSDYIVDGHLEALLVEFKGAEGHIPISFPYSRRTRNYFFHRGIGNLTNDAVFAPAITCESFGPGLLDDNTIAGFWDKVALTEDEDHAVRSLGLIFGAEIDRIAVIGDRQRVHGIGGRRVMVKLKSYGEPVPLKGLGDGALRIFGVALALANSRGGFLLIDEAENGIHHSVQRDYWRMILQSAQENNVQILATTHSWDCVRGFAEAAAENEEAEGHLIRLSRQYGDLRAIEYSEEELAIAAEQGIEVR